MKNFILGVLIAVCFSYAAIEHNLLTVKPATPKAVIVERFYEADTQYLENFIKTNCDKGYIVKTVSCGNDRSQYSSTCLVIMEKY